MKLKHKTLKIIAGILILALVVTVIILALPKIMDFAVYILRLFLPFIIAYLFALAVNPLVRKMQQKLHIPRTAAGAIVIVLLVGGLGSIIVWALYKIINESKTLYSQFPQIYASLTQEIEIIKIKLSGIYDNFPPNIQQSLQSVSESVSSAAANIINTKSMPIVISAGSVAKAFPKALVSTIVFLLATFFIISDFEHVNMVVKKPFRQSTHEKLAILSEQIKKYLGGYIKAQGIIMIVVFFILFIGLSILKIEYGLLIALGTAFLDALPFFGSGAVLWPWSIISFITGNFKTGFGLIIMYVIIIITRQSIEPKIVSKNIGMNPLLTLISMYLGFKLLSIGGMILGPIILMLVFSFYKAHMFDAPIEFIKKMQHYLSERLHEMKIQFIKFWESD